LADNVVLKAVVKVERIHVVCRVVGSFDGAALHAVPLDGRCSLCKDSLQEFEGSHMGAVQQRRIRHKGSVLFLRSD